MYTEQDVKLAHQLAEAVFSREVSIACFDDMLRRAETHIRRAARRIVNGLPFLVMDEGVFVARPQQMTGARGVTKL